MLVLLIMGFLVTVKYISLRCTVELTRDFSLRENEGKKMLTK